MGITSVDWMVALAPLAGWHETAERRDCQDLNGGRLRHLAIRFLVWQARRETVRILRSVDSATLRDLGIADIESEVYGEPKDRRRGYDPCWWRKQ